ncbi:hypothetical protein HMPREF9071_1990 [Capnocytophaga sp. oral taxon 338 str. F0234]|nr:hypothetical protein HMPREF9071_1990 [Capnocytophaga sp. oral taxon 338 str. F0234]
MQILIFFSNMKIISNFLKTTLLLASIGLFLVSCSKPSSSTDETKDRGHEMPDKVVFIVTNMATKEQQKREANKSPKGIQYDISDPIVWKSGQDYLFEIIYYNNGRRLNGEFVTEKMAPIHQHFFELYQGEYPKNTEGREKMVSTMNSLVSYKYQDTNPENAYLGNEGVSLLKRTWDKKNPQENDPIGLKGIFTINQNPTEGDFRLRIKLAHFLVANKLEPSTGKIRPYNVMIYSNAFVLDSNMELLIKLIK